MKVVNLKEFNVGALEYFVWCKENKIPVMRINLLKYRLKEEDYMIFLLKFKRDAFYRKTADYDEYNF